MLLHEEKKMVATIYMKNAENPLLKQSLYGVKLK